MRSVTSRVLLATLLAMFLAGVAIPAIAAIDDRIQQLENPLSRSMMISSLYDMSETGRMPIKDYVILAVEEMQLETNIRVLAQLTHSIASSIDVLYRLRPESENALAEIVSVVGEETWQRVTTENDPDRARLWFNLLLESSSGQVAQDRLRALLDGAVSLPAVQLSEDLRWNVLIKLDCFHMTRLAPDKTKTATTTKQQQRNCNSKGPFLAV